MPMSGFTSRTAGKRTMMSHPDSGGRLTMDGEVVVEAEPPEATGVVDLMEALERSVEASRTKRGKKKVS